MNKEEWVSHVDQSIEKALKGESNLTEETLKPRGFSPATMRHLFNNLCNIKESDPVMYLEVGLYCGATFCASFNENTISVGIENFSQDFGVPSVKEELYANIEMAKTVLHPHLVRVIDMDCFSTNHLDGEPPTGNFDIFFFDGEHSLESQAKALPHFFGNMGKLFLFIVDDWHWPQVENGTRDSFSTLADKMDIEKEWIIKAERPSDDPIWHNGVGIFLISKK